MTTAALSAEALWAGGAVVVASLVALLGVNLQTARTLKAERGRLDDQLRAEQERLETQLAHDRATQERGELRSVLDNAAACIFELAFAASELMAPVTRIIGDAEEAGKDKSEALALHAADTSRDGKLDAMFALIRRADGHACQIGIRLGSNHPVCEQYSKSKESFSSLHGKLADLDIDQADELWDAIREAGAAAGEFEFNAFALVRSDLGGNTQPSRVAPGE